MSAALLSLAAALSVAAGHPGMVELKAGLAKVGEGEAAREVQLPRFYLDKARVSAADYQACVKAGGCAPAPASGGVVEWGQAERYCAHQGKRLPTEAELEVGAALVTPGAGLEWSGSWFVRPSACRAPKLKLEKASEGAWAAAFCGARDRLNACEGAMFCGKLYRRVAKDLKAGPKARAGVNAYKGKRQLAFRCATDRARLSTGDTLAQQALGPPAPPSEAELALFRAVTADTVEVPPCEEPGRSFADCRDPRSYLKSNEPLLNVVLPHISNLGGAYAGVGSDQSYTFIAEAKSRWVWLFDYDINVVRWHEVMRALILEAKTRQAFVAFFDKSQEKAGVAALHKHARDPAHGRVLRALYRGARGPLRSHYRRQKDQRAWSWLGADARYSYVRTLYQQGRMIALQGNLLDKNAMVTIAAAARALKVPVRIYYPSNAPEFWPFTDQYRENVRGLPFDDESVVVQTISKLSLKSGFGQKGYWHYNVQHGLSQQARLLTPGITRHKQLLFHRRKSESPELTLTDMPAR